MLAQSYADAVRNTSMTPCKDRHGKDYAKRPDLRVALILCGLAGRFGSTWVFPSQSKICELLAKRFRRTMSRRNLNRHLGGLERAGYFDRIRRHRRGPRGEIEMHSTVYRIGARALREFGPLQPFLSATVRRLVDKLGITAVTKMAQCNASIITIMTGGVLTTAPPPV